MPDVEAHLDKVLSEGAAQVAEEMVGNDYNYRLDPLGYMVQPSRTDLTGRCRVLGVYYSKHYDCNVYHLLDLDSEHEFDVDQFEIELTLI